MNSTPETRYTLIAKLRNPQDAEAWAEFTNIYQPLIFRICLTRGLQYADATDVTQDVLAKVAGVIESFSADQQGATFRGWLYRITRNLVVDFFRQRQKNPLVQAGRVFELTEANDPTVAESLEFQKEFQRQIFWLVAQEVKPSVKPKTWRAFWQSEIENRPIAQVAAELQMTTGAVYVARSRVLARLKREVERRMDETNDFFV